MSDEQFHEQVEHACETACAAIAPAWPLDQAIAVNPHWQRVHLPIGEVAARMAVLGKIRVFPSRGEQLRHWESGRIQPADLAEALHHVPQASEQGLTAEQCVNALKTPTPLLPELSLLIDRLDDDPKRHTRLSWRDAITYQVSQTCAAYFDQFQADWQPLRSGTLYDFWRDTLTHDHGIGLLMGLPNLGQSLSALPKSRQDAERWALRTLGLPANVWADYLESVLLTVNGWASWCAYQGWQAKLAGTADDHLRELLALRLAWGAILVDCSHDDAAGKAFAQVQTQWAKAPELIAQARQLLVVDEVWQTAFELNYQNRLAAQLTQANRSESSIATPNDLPSYQVQAAFCIDVRSEPLRRALEKTVPQIQTLGFAGFFGLPLRYTPSGTQAARPQLPGLLAPTLQVTDAIRLPGTQTASDGQAEDALNDTFVRDRLRRLNSEKQWLGTGKWPATSFSYVEAAGIAYLGKLSGWLKPKTTARKSDDRLGIAKRYQPICRPALLGLGLDEKIKLATTVLDAMGLRDYLAPWVLLVGHGSHTTNNPHAAALDCGACCGQTGEINARVLASLLNDPKVQAALAQNGFNFSKQPQFVAALHNTTTDEFEWYDLDLLPQTSQTSIEDLKAAIEQACELVRRERASSLGLDPALQAEQLFKRLRQRANDGAQTRPEWGLARNAAFLIAPRSRSLDLDLDGRVFLHDYNPAQDADGSLLELLMTAPMLVTHWINWQYHASVTEPVKFGSGNKLLHNVVGGHLGVFEGNGGDLRIGLAEQSVHNGQDFVHEPLRLTVVIDAPAQAIDAVLAKHSVVNQLVVNGWLHLWRFQGHEVQHKQPGGWVNLKPRLDARPMNAAAPRA